MALFPANIDVSTLDGTNGFKLNGVKEATAGWSVASAGDVNGDGIDDLIIGAPVFVFGFPQPTQKGAGYVVFGSASGLPGNFDLSSLDGSNGFKLSATAIHDYTGYSVASAG